MATGAFINFPLIYQVPPNDGGLTPDQQAIAILKKGKQTQLLGFPVVAIIVLGERAGNARFGRRHIAAGNDMAGIDGANQAQVMNAMEAHLGDQDWSELQMKVPIAPITTIPGSGQRSPSDRPGRRRAHSRPARPRLGDSRLAKPDNCPPKGTIPMRLAVGLRGPCLPMSKERSETD